MVAMLVGILLGPSVLNLVDPSGWGDHYVIVEEVSRLVIAIQLITIGLGFVFIPVLLCLFLYSLQHLLSLSSESMEDSADFGNTYGLVDVGDRWFYCVSR
jgi:NhaP-type Na+/H+ or K+/H+ antiporter